MMNKNGNIQTFLGCDNKYDEAGIVIFGAPFDSTTSYRPGTRFASRIMRSESFGIETYSPYQDKDLSDKAIYDSGDLELPFGDTAQAIAMIEETAAEILADGKIPYMIGGEHLVTLGAVRAAAKKYPDLHVIQFDAHTDLRDDYLGQELSHATVMHRIWDLLGSGRIFQFGIRSGERAEFEWAKQKVSTVRFNFTGLDAVIASLQGKPVYFTLDLDVLDPSVFPGTGTPEAGGVDFLQLHQAVLDVCTNLHIVGADINELSPGYDNSGASTAVACKIMREMLLAIE
ncbi:MAG: agmatinase [Saccharofermentanales bacterium]